MKPEKACKITCWVAITAFALSAFTGNADDALFIACVMLGCTGLILDKLGEKD